MCGRYKLSRADKDIAAEFGVAADLDYSPRYNIAPSQNVFAIRAGDEGHLASFMRWGLIPPWAKDEKIGYKMINARSETVLEKPAYRAAFKKRRCLIPADGFYEWKKEGARKQPMHFGMKDGALFAFAGLWEQWRSPEGKMVESCAILTTAANELVAPTHDRMPVILPRQTYKLWLTAEAEQAERLTDLLLPFDPAEMSAYAVSELVNSPKNERAEVAQRVG